jgi:NDP-sugar pyrophosphorylase family protein/aminoglycoside/choline kinase family phosphotransferase
MSLSVFILAAGLGERLRPITDHIPKPLLPVMGKPVLESVLKKVSSLPANRLGINLHYKKDIIGNWISKSAYKNSITLFPEDPVLGTGGALKNAEEFLRDGLFLVHNADILSEIDLGKLIAFHKESGNLATLAVHDFPEFNSLVFDDNGYLLEIGTLCSLCRKPDTRLLAFTGIAVYAPEFLNVLSEGASSVVHAWTQAISAGEKIGAYNVSGSYWSDVGTPLSYAKTVIHELRKDGETVYIHPSTTGCSNIEIDGYTVIENESMLNENVFLRNCFLLPGSRAETIAKYENCILGPGFRIDLDEAEMFDACGDKETKLIGTGGSDRKYYRTNRSDRSVVVMQCPNNDPDFQRHSEYTHFFRRYAVPVPEIFETDPGNMKAYIEDLGDLSLYSWLKCPRNQDEIKGMYKKVLDILISIHTTLTEHVSGCPLLQSRVFDYDHLRWESNYFLDWFVKGTMDSEVKNRSALEDEFHKLALTVDSFPKSVVHRDFQSQNIMITRGGMPGLLDFQGARIGPPAYDLVSFLWDPYHRLDDQVRGRLFDYYTRKRSLHHSCKKGMESPQKTQTGDAFSVNGFRETMLPCRLQRHMQALGAYGFLSSVKGKKYFIKYIPEGMRLLREDIEVARNEYPMLYELVIRLSNVISAGTSKMYNCF